jgi:hypothetical protein
MNNFKKYQKEVSRRDDLKVTSVNITKDQSKFLSDSNINLSLFIRDQIDNLIKSIQKKAV